MACLPQNDPSPTRADELAERRSRYEWDHDYLPPFPFLKVPEVKGTGVLNVGDILVGTLAGVPVEEQPSAEFMLDKVNSNWPVVYELMQGVTREEWLELIDSVLTLLDVNALGWTNDTVVAIRNKLLKAALLGQEMPEIDELAEEVVSVLVKAAVEVGVVIDTLDGGVELDASTAVESYQQIADSSLPEPLKRIIIPLQAFFRFIARKSAKRLQPPDGVVDDSQLVVELPPWDSINPNTDDIEFAYRQLGGSNPITLRRIDKSEDLPKQFPIRDEHLRDSLVAQDIAETHSLESAAAAGRLYLADYAILADIECQSGPHMDFFGQVVHPDQVTQRYLPAPFGLFIRTDAGLRPVAIQLGRDPKRFEVFTPADGDVWRRVKLFYNVADFHHLEICTHLAQGHLRFDGFIVATARQLHTEHPVSVLLRPHMRTHLWNDFIGRQVLYCEGGLLPQLLSPGLDGILELLARRCEEITFADLHFPSALANRGVDDAEALPDYVYRDDGLRVWKAQHSFVSNYLALYYKGPDDLSADSELQAWLAEMAADDGARLAGMPSVTELGDLVEIVAALIFNGSAFHSAANYTQYNYMGRGTEVPSTAIADPEKVRDISWEEILPGGELLTTQALVGATLVGQRDQVLTELDIGDFPDPGTWPVLAAYRRELGLLDRELAERNAGPERAYTGMMPSEIAASANV